MLIFEHRELLSHTFPHELYLIDPVMPQGGVVLMHGKRGLGKTQLALTLAMDILQGLPFLGCLPSRQGQVAYVQLDIPPQLQQSRVQQLLLDAPGLRWYLDNTQIDITASGALSDAWVDDIRAYAPACVIVDTLRKSHRLDENSSDTPVAVYGAWREAVGQGPTLIFLHHDRKTSFDGPGDRDEEFRGSGAWLDEVDLGMHLIRTRSGLAMEWSKCRTFDPDSVGKSFALQMDPQTLLLQASNPTDAYVRDALRRGLPHAQIARALQDASRFGRYAVSQATAYRRISALQGG